jgi:hypothetical protein
MKNKIMLCVLLVVILLPVLSCLSAQNSDKFNTDLEYQYLMDNSKGLVVFNHQAHADMLNDCLVCHHNGEPNKCETCHTEDHKVNTKTAYHKNCKGCHKKLKQGPTKCSGCHKK